MKAPSKISHLDLESKTGRLMTTHTKDDKSTNFNHISSLDRINSFRIQNIRTSVVIGLLLLTFINANFNIINQKSEIGCYIDRLQEFTNIFFSFFESHMIVSSFLLSTISALTDILFLSTCFIIIMDKRANMRFFLSFAVFYVLSFISKHLFLIKKNENIFNSIFPSLIVNYDNDDCFIFITEIGVLNIILHEFDQRRKHPGNDFLNNSIYYATIFLMLFSAFMRIACRGSYFPSIAVSYFFSSIIFTKSEQYVEIKKIQYLKKNRKFSSSI